MYLEERITVVYCGACGMPPEYCEYGPDYESHCLPWLLKHHPALYKKLQGNDGSDKNSNNENEEGLLKKERPTEPWTIEERLTAFYEKYDPTKVDKVDSLLEKYEGKEEKLFQALVKKYGPEPDDPYYDEDGDDDDHDDDDDNNNQNGKDLNTAVNDMSVTNNKNNNNSTKKKRRGVGAKKTNKVDTRVVIQKISRNRKKATTVVIGMDTVPDIKLKDVSKAFSKRFAGSSSVKDGPQGKEIIVQGDHMDDAAQMVVNKFGVPGDSVYLDIDGEFVPYQ